MASGSAPALDPNVAPKNEAAQAAASHPASLGQRVIAFLHRIFERGEESTGWRQ